MSMKNYSVCEYGLVLKPEVLREIASRIFDDFSQEEWEINSCAYISDIVDCQGFNYISEFSGEIIPFFIEKNEEKLLWERSVSYDCKSIVYIPTLKYPKMFSSAYNNAEELISEIKKNVEELLPTDFDFMQNIYLIVGTYMG